MNIIESIVLGIIQGLTEFLPVSSTAHLILAPWFFGFKDPGLYFDVALHLGTLLAILLFFWRDFLKIFMDMIKSEERGIVFWYLVVATIPGALFGVLLESKVESIFRSPALIAFSLAIFGVIIWVIDRKVKKERKIEEVGFKDALLIGFSQALALVPGVSRSGITMVMGRCLGFTREASVRFSFLLSAPIIFGSVMAGALKIFKGKEAMSFNYLDLGVGVLTSFIFGFLAIRFLIKYVSKNNFDIFVIYRLALASLILIALMYS